MNENQQQQLEGRLFAHELILGKLLKHYVDHQLPDSGKVGETEHLDAFVRDLQTSVLAQASKMTPTHAAAATQTVFDLLGVSLQKYWETD